MKENKYHIPIVGDEQGLYEILRFNLETEGYVVETANSAGETMMMDISSFNLLLLDVMVSEISGFPMVKRLRENPKTVGIPIIFLTAHDTENDTVTDFNLGVDDYINKPFSIRKVLVRTCAVIRRANETDDHTEPKTLRYQGLEMDLDRKAVTTDGKDVSFTKTEFELLHLFPSEKGHIFSRWELIDRIWPEDVLVFDRTVNVNITRLRRKTGRFSKCIVTRLDPGYYFDIL